MTTIKHIAFAIFTGPAKAAEDRRAFNGGWAIYNPFNAEDKRPPG